MLCYNTSYYRTNDTSPFELTYGMKPRLAAFPMPEFDRINYGEGFVAKRLQLLKKAKQIALEESMVTKDSYKKDHDARANHHNG
jgi:hypothetical protein